MTSTEHNKNKRGSRADNQNAYTKNIILGFNPQPTELDTEWKIFNHLPKEMEYHSAIIRRYPNYTNEKKELLSSF